MCLKVNIEEYDSFCSKRCKYIDVNRYSGETYVEYIKRKGSHKKKSTKRLDKIKKIRV